MWSYQLWVLFDRKWHLWQEGSRDQVMAVMSSSREAARLTAMGASGWKMAQEFHSLVH